MKAIRDQYDPNGGRAIGSREMLDQPEAEYGGEMLYINKSADRPMWAMEYCRDEAYRLYWDSYSYPFHKQGDGPLVKGQPATAYNQNNDEFAIELLRRWHEYWAVRPGTGRRRRCGLYAAGAGRRRGSAGTNRLHQRPRNVHPPE